MDGAIPLGQPEAVRDLAHGSGLDDVALVLTAAVVVVVAVVVMVIKIESTTVSSFSMDR